MQDTGEIKTKIDIWMFTQSSLIGFACGLAYEFMGYLLQFAWGGIEVHSGPVSQIRFPAGIYHCVAYDSAGRISTRYDLSAIPQ